MATIITLQAPRHGRSTETEHRGGATILFFTGVRYVRDEPDETADAALAADPQSVFVDAATAEAAASTIN